MNRSINLSEKNLKTDMRDISREVVHELFLICRKAGIYAIDHPMVIKGIAKPFLGMQRAFGFKKYFSLYFAEGRLYANNILMSDAGATNYLKEKMHDFEIRSILFEDTLTTEELTAFISRVVAQIKPDDPDYYMDSYLERRRIQSIKINTPLGDKLFNSGLRYREGQCQDYSVRRLVADYFSGDVNLAVTLLTNKYGNAEEQANDVGIDYHCEIVKYLLPEKFAQLALSDLIGMARHILDGSDEFDESALEQLRKLIHSFDYHPKRVELMDSIQRELTERGIEDSLIKQSLSVPAAMKMEISQGIDSTVNGIFSDNCDESQYDLFHDQFMRLVRTRQMGKASSIAEAVIMHLSSENSLYRQHSLVLIKDIVNCGLSVGELGFLDVVLGQLKTLFTRGLETFEFSEVAVTLLRLLIANRRYEPVVEFLNVVGTGRRQDDGVTVYDSVTVRRIFDDLNDKELLSFIIREIYQPENSKIKSAREVLIAIQSEEVALQLAQIVAHPSRHVRRHCLKILSELGRPAVKVFTEIVRDEKNFQRPPERRELPDEKWYLVRNAIFVLGNLKDAEACHALRMRLSDPDVRVRLEIVRALEKIGGDDAIDLLMILAEDSESSIREAAIIALGFFKQSNLFPFFKDLLQKQNSETNRIINAIALTGVEEARQYLMHVLESKEELKKLASPKASIPEIKKMIINALEKFGDEIAKKKAKNFKVSDESNLTKTAKLLLSKFNSSK